MVELDLKEKYRNRRKQLYSQNLIGDLALLLLPSLLLGVLFTLSFYTYGISILLTYFILPMFYTVDYRIRNKLTEIGNDDFTYKDGYAAFFKSNKGNFYGVIKAIVIFLVLLLIFAVFIGIAFPLIVRCFPEAIDTYEELVSTYNSFYKGDNQFLNLIYEEGANLSRPIIVFFGIVSFIPLAFSMFGVIGENLSNDYLAHIVLPDIDKNISPAQSRNVAKASFGKDFFTYRVKQQMMLNWPYYLIYAIVYASLLYGMSNVINGYVYNVPLLFSSVPGFMLMISCYLNYFTIANRYIVIEENKQVLYEMIPSSMRIYIYQTFNTKEYVHGEESEKRGAFYSDLVLSKKYESESTFIGVVDLSEDKEVNKQ